MREIDFEKCKGLVPAIVQDSATRKVLMMGYMDEEALAKTKESGKVTFFSRSKNRLWTKGETSGNFLELESMEVDCDGDTLLVQARPIGPACHKGDDTCWAEKNEGKAGFLTYLEQVIEERSKQDPSESYTASLFAQGVNKVAQKVGEEAVEVVIEAKDNDEGLFLDESADLLFHYLMLLKFKGYGLDDVVSVLEKRHAKMNAK